MDTSTQYRLFRSKRTSLKRSFTITQNKLVAILDQSSQSDTDMELVTEYLSNLQKILIDLRQNQDGVLANCPTEEEDRESTFLDDPESDFLDNKKKVKELLASRKKPKTLAPLARKPITAGHSSHFEEFKTAEDDIIIDDTYRPEEEEDEEDRVSLFRAGKKRTESNLSKEDKQMYALLSMNYKAKNDVPKFTGEKVSKYPSWRQTWDTADAKLERMGKTPSEKLIELKQCLGGEAKELIDDLPDAIDDNYPGALKLLDDYYHDNALTAKTAIDRLLDMPAMTNDPKSMSQVYVALTNIDQVLKGLTISSAQCKTLMFTALAERKLNAFTKKAWVRKCEAKEDKTTPLGTSATEQDLFGTIRSEIKLARKMSNGPKEEKKKEEKKKPETSTLPASFTANKGEKDKSNQDSNCPFCKKTDHPAWKCMEFKSRSVDERWKLVNQARVCKLCFGTHKTDKCKLKPCKIDSCGKMHNHFLHPTKFAATNAQQVNGQASATSPPPSSSCCSNASQTQTSAILQTCMAYAVSMTGERFKARIFLDSGSEISLITRDLVNKMGLAGTPTQLRLHVAGGGEPQSSQERNVSIQLEALDGSYISPPIEMTTKKKVTEKLREVPVDPKAFAHLQSISFAEELPRKSAPVDILLGLPYYHLVVSGLPIMGKPDQPMALPTKLGYVLTGSFQQVGATTVAYTSAACSVEMVNQNLERFWKLDSIGITEPKPEHADLTEDEVEAIRQMEEKTKYHSESKSWSTSLLFKEPPTDLPLNYDMAKAVMMSVEKTMAHSGKAEMVNDAFKEMQAPEFSEKVPASEINKQPGEAHYLQCHPVFREDKATTKCRIVMNASAKRRGQKSLNDYLLMGPCLLPDFIKVLLRFRCNRSAFALDISKMFLRIKIDEGKDFMRFIWRNGIQNTDPEVWRLTSVAFGFKSSPFQASFTLRKHADLFKDKFPLAQSPIHWNTYMDDTTDGDLCQHKARQMLHQLVALLQEASMLPHKIVSNDKAILEGLPMELLLQQENVKILGVNWNTTSDSLTFQIGEALHERADTKRTFLKAAATVFDPLGLIAPFLMRMKLLFQSLWMKNVGWDESLPPDIQEDWDTWRQEAKELASLSRTRCFFDKHKSVPKFIDIYAFGDASILAYATAVFIVATYEDDTTTSELAMAKTRVAPKKMVEDSVKTETIVRLELLAALITSRALSYVREAWEGKIKIRNTYCFSDSMINLHRIRRGPERFKVWVGNRITEILSLTKKSDWFFCPGTENPADHPAEVSPPRNSLNQTFGGMGRSSWANHLQSGPRNLATGQWTLKKKPYQKSSP